MFGGGEWSLSDEATNHLGGPGGAYFPGKVLDFYSTETGFLAFWHEYFNLFAQLKPDFCKNMIHMAV